uniref:Uncharacterized protein n=1 Tax=Aegilops tauschii subsp. strangulata TaxID=200361 RepID=A0A453KZ29_AEGTS
AYLLFRCYCYNHYKTQKYYFWYCYRYYHTTLLLNTLLQILSYLGVVELTTQLLILENILWLPMCRINKFGLNTLPSKTVAIPYTCGLSVLPWECVAPMCGFQAKGNGFFYIHDASTPKQNTDRNRYIVITVIEGQANGRQLEEFFNAYINTNWKCSARSIGFNTFVMRLS